MFRLEIVEIVHKTIFSELEYPKNDSTYLIFRFIGVRFIKFSMYMITVLILKFTFHI